MKCECGTTTKWGPLCKRCGRLLGQLNGPGVTIRLRGVPFFLADDKQVSEKNYTFRYEPPPSKTEP